MNLFGLNGNNGAIPPIMPNSQVVIPQITIPQGLSAQLQNYSPYGTQSVKQYTAKSESAARSMVFPPNSRIAIFDEDLPIFYYREIGANGEDVVFKKCSYAEIEEPAPPEYLTVEQFKSGMEEFKKELKEEFYDAKFVRAQNGDRPRNGNPGKSYNQQSAESSDSK